MIPGSRFPPWGPRFPTTSAPHAAPSRYTTRPTIGTVPQPAWLLTPPAAEAIGSINWPAGSALGTMRPAALLRCLLINFMTLDQVPMNTRAAHWLADAVAMAVSLVRPLSTYTEEVEVAPDEWADVPQRNMLVSAAPGLPLWHLDAWRDRDSGPEGCLHVHALGCRIEVFYLRGPTVQAAS